MESIIARFETLLQKEDFRDIRAQISEIRAEFIKRLAEFNKATYPPTTDEEGNTQEQEYPQHETEKQLEELFAKYNERKEAYQKEREAMAVQRAEQEKQRQAAEEQKVKDRTTLLSDLKTLVESGDQSNEAMDKLKAIQAEWKKIGNVKLPKGKEQDLDYKYQIDMFFHNRKILQDLRDMDRQLNLDLKTVVISKLEKLQEEGESTMGKIADTMRQLQNEWKQIGPVILERKDELNNRYKELSDQIYAKIKDYFDSRRSEMQQNSEAKKAMIEKATAIVESSGTNTDPKKWQDKSSEIVALQGEWSKIGYSEKNEQLWSEFRTVCDNFFEAKKDFFKNVDRIREENKQKKVELCLKAESVQESTDWKATNDYLIKLQKEWKSVGSAPRADENKLWERFRTACDKFFDAKKENSGSLNADQETNWQAKSELITRLEAMEFTENASDDFQKLKDFAAEWANIGLVPFNKKDAIYERYYKALDAKYEALKANREERPHFRQPRHEQSRNHNVGGNNSGNNKERQTLQDRITGITADIQQYENNLGFFGNNANSPIVKQVQEKVNRLRTELNELRQQLSDMNKKPASETPPATPAVETPTVENDSLPPATPEGETPETTPLTEE